MSEQGREITHAEIKERARINRLKPTESMFKGRKGYYRKYRPNGSYEWGYNFTPNDGHGRLTKQAHEVAEAMQPFTRSSTEFEARNQRDVPRETLKNGNGEVQHVDASRARAIASANGWKPARAIT